jgi:hypothetical protein
MKVLPFVLGLWFGVCASEVQAAALSAGQISGPAGGARASLAGSDYSNQSLRGPWFFLRSTYLGYVIADGNGTLTEVSMFNARTPPGSYSVQPDGRITMVLHFQDGDFGFSGRFISPTEIRFDPPNDSYVMVWVRNPALCQGFWTGRLQETGTTNVYLVSFDVDATGAVSNFTGLPGPVTGHMFGESGGRLAARFWTRASDAYDQVHVSGTLNCATVSAIYGVDNGSGDDGVALLTLSSHFDGIDDFNDNSKDTNRWGIDVVSAGAGVLTETRERLEYSSSLSDSSSCLRPWAVTASVTESWAVRAELHVPPAPLTNDGQAVFMGLGVKPMGSSSSNRLGIYLGTGVYHGRLARFWGVILHEASGQSVMTNVVTTSQSGYVRLRWEATTTTLSADYDSDGSLSDHTWANLLSINLPSYWNLAEVGSFGIGIFGQSENTTVGSTNDLYADNMMASTGPFLSLRRTETNAFVVSWPKEADCWMLEWTPQLVIPSRSNTWYTIPEPYPSNTTHYYFVEPVPLGTKLYQLRRR